MLIKLISEVSNSQVSFREQDIVLQDVKNCLFCNRNVFILY